MKEENAKKKNNKQKTTRPTNKAEQTKLRRLLNQLHEDEVKDRYKNSDSRQRAEDILNLIRSRQAETAKMGAEKFLNKFFEYIIKRI